MRMRAGLIVVALVLGACGTDDGVEGESTLPAADSLTPAQQQARRDSAIARSNLPGARGVGGAMDAVEASRAHAEATDTMLP